MNASIFTIIMDSAATVAAIVKEYHDPNNSTDAAAVAGAVSKELQDLGTHAPDADNLGTITSHVVEAIGKGQAAPTDLLTDLEVNMANLHVNPAAQSFLILVISQVMSRL